MEIKILNTFLKVKEDGTIKRKMVNGKWKEIKNKQNHSKGYNVILINKKQFMRSNIIAFCFTDFDLYDKKYMVHHKDLDRLNCQLDNIVLVKKINNKKV